ncbi:MAG: hypothetical protein ACRD3D_08945 [Terriglobia bacterium]
MPAKLVVEKIEDGKFRVTVSEARAAPPRVVTLRSNYYQKLTAGKITDEELVRRSFEFLLAREPEESILTEFDLTVIARYFPEYEGEMKRKAGA